ncbi:MAG: hypothetical protein J5794_04940 [Lachnospiraceae bacterium]|nr:hypothetical protein [Lachnospiraceae bacterium]
MKAIRIISLLLAGCLLSALCACSGQNPLGSGGKELGSDASPAEISEAAMANFVQKLNKGNYVVEGGQSGVVNAYSPEQVYIVYGDKKKDSVTYAFMTLKGETFETMIDGSGKIGEVAFRTTENAIDALGETLPNYWMKVTGNNMWELFYNSVENPLEFTSNDWTVKYTLGAMGGYGQFTVQKMEEVHMTFDAVDPTTVHFTAVVPDETIVKYDDLDLTLKFGTAKPNNRIEQWLKKPVYPQERVYWTREDIQSYLDIVFGRGYGEAALPFPAVSSYAMSFDENAYSDFGAVILTDPHWTEKDVEEYKALLKSSGFAEGSGTIIDGSNATVYRKPLREEYGAYSQVYLEYDHGLVLVGDLYYDIPEYSGFEAVSAAVRKNGFLALPETDVFTEWKGQDSSGIYAEGIIYFVEFNFRMVMDLTYTDKNSAEAYLKNYAAILTENGFVSKFTAGEDNGYVESPNTCVSFEYRFDYMMDQPENTVCVKFENRKTLTVDELNAVMREHGLPETDFHGDINARDVAKYYFEMSGFEGVHLCIYQPYESVAAAEAYLNAYVPGLEEQGYYETDPKRFNCYRTFLYFNEDLKKYVAFQINPGDETGDTNICFEIVSIEPGNEDLMLSVIRR